MKQKININLAVGMFIGLVLASTRPALAYLDPGSGSYLIQVIIASMVAGGVMVGAKWQQFKEFLTKTIKKNRNGSKK